MNSRIAGVSIGMATASGLMAAMFGIPAAMMILVWTTLVVALLRFFFPRAMGRWLNRFNAFLAGKT